ncbi:MAG: LysM peptidoglycan-binding domain-containing protein [Ginsengibacter sp.]
MRKWLFIILVMFAISQFSFAQNNLIEVRSSGDNLYLDHKVTAKETLYSLGRLYNVPPKELASFNKLALTTGLNLGQNLKIPLNKINFAQSEMVSGNEVVVPVYHTLQAHETLFRLSLNYNKVPVDALKKWNHLQSDAVNIATPLIVGFLKVDKTQSALAAQAYMLETINPKIINEEVTKTLPANTSAVAPKEMVGLHENVKVQEPVAQIEKVAEEKIAVSAPMNQHRIDFAGGTFKPSYEKQNHVNSDYKSSISTGGIFKSTSGWQDGKYYCFNNDASAGTVLKITDKQTGKSIYAKVLDVIPDIKQNTGLQIIISNAAADELGVGEKFECDLSQ